MKESVNIQELFAKASQEPVLTSFEETKKAFLKSAPGGAGIGKSGFFGKNWIIMLSSFVTIAIVATIFLMPAEKKAQKEPAKSQKAIEATSEPTKKKEKATIPMARSEKKRKEINFSGKLMPKPLEVSYKNVLQQLSYHPLKPKSRYVPREFYRFPILTEDDKKENEKRKRNMAKELVKKDKNAYAYIPSASIYIDTQKVSIQAFYIQKHEVTNIQYKTFLFDLLIQGRKDDFLKAKPDQNKWVELYGEGMRTMTDNYFSHDAYNDYPVVNVSREGAEMYCKWLTLQAHIYSENHREPFINDLRLPQRAEWIYAAGGGDTTRVYSVGEDSLKNEKSCYLANYKPLPDNFHADGGFNTVKVDSYLPNTFGLFNMSGNAAEMVYESAFQVDLPTSTKVSGTAGGSWENSEEALRILGPDPYDGIEYAHPAIGFRVVSTHLRKE